jgi:hypothetical protein
MTATEIFGRLTAEQASDVLNWLAENERNAYRSTAAMLATRRKLRPVFLERKPRNERNRWMAEALAKTQNTDLALEILQVWTLGKNEKLVCDFLDALEIPHDGKGLIDELPAEPSADRVAKAVELILGKHGAVDVCVYLHLFSDMDEGRWPTLKSMLASNPALTLEPVATLA